MQLAHAGRKAPTTPPAAGGKPILTKEEGGWIPEAPSAIPCDTGWPVPHAMTKDDIKRCVGDFAAAAKRVDHIGYDVIELHGGHGYLLHQFMSPISNKRSDEYGGSTENRIRFPIEVYQAVRAVWPEQKPLGIRVSATDWVDGGWTPEETVVLAKELKKLDCDYIDVSTGGTRPEAEDSAGAGLPGSVRREGQAREWHHYHDRRLDRRLPAGRGIRGVREDRPDLPRARRHVGPALGVACRRGTWRGDTVCAEDDGLPSEVAASIVSEAGAAGKLRRINALCAQASELVRGLPVADNVACGVIFDRSTASARCPLL